MTTGQTTKDLRVPYGTACGAGFAGYFYQKTWNGSDYPAVERQVEKNIWVYPKFDSYLVNPVESSLSRLSSVSPHRRYVRTLRREGYVRTIWKKPPKRHFVEDHAYSTSWVEYLDPVMHWSFPNSPLQEYEGLVLSCFGGPPNFVDPWNDSDQLALLGKLREKLVGSNFNAGVFIAEGKESLGLVRESARRIAKALTSLKRGRVDLAVRRLIGTNVSDNDIRQRRLEFYRRLGRKPPPQVKLKKLRPGEVYQDSQLDNAWLSIQYGWLPLLSDAHSGAEAIAHFVDEPGVYEVRVSRYAGGKRELANSPTGDQYYLLRPRVKHVYSRRQIIARLREKDVAKLTGLTDPLSIAWELVPYSFVVDWFIPIGQYLEARGMSHALEGTFVTSHKFSQYYGKLTRDLRGTAGYYIDSPVWYHRSGNFSRTISYNLDVPYPNIKPLAKSLSWLHCSNAVALLTSRFKR